MSSPTLQPLFPADAPSYRSTVGDHSWFVQDRFGLFIHWGLYSLAARHEWVQHLRQIPEDVYADHYLPRFDPDLYDPAAWARAAADAGMRYVVVTAKHHEGFCLWDSAMTDYKATNAPAGRDLLRPMLSAFRDQGLRTGVYYSLIDWHHPQYFVDPHIGPYRNATNRDAINRDRDPSRYARYMREQVRELLTGYGPIDVVWFDFSYPKEDGTGKGKADWESPALLELVRSLRPTALVNDRLDLLDDPQGRDFRTVEQAQPIGRLAVEGEPVVWEACHAFGSAWGYKRSEQDWKSADDVIRLLIDCVSKGGNLLLNVGPTGRGEFDERSLSRLADIGKWMRRHGRSIYDCGAAPPTLRVGADCRLTYNARSRRLYLHILNWFEGPCVIEGVSADAFAYAQLLHDASEVDLLAGLPEGSAATCSIKLPATAPDVAVVVVELFVKDGA